MPPGKPVEKLNKKTEMRKSTSDNEERSLFEHLSTNEKQEKPGSSSVSSINKQEISHESISEVNKSKTLITEIYSKTGVVSSETIGEVSSSSRLERNREILLNADTDSLPELEAINQERQTTNNVQQEVDTMWQETQRIQRSFNRKQQIINIMPQVMERTWEGIQQRPQDIDPGIEQAWQNTRNGLDNLHQIVNDLHTRMNKEVQQMDDMRQNVYRTWEEMQQTWEEMQRIQQGMNPEINQVWQGARRVLHGLHPKVDRLRQEMNKMERDMNLSANGITQEIEQILQEINQNRRRNQLNQNALNAANAIMEYVDDWLKIRQEF